MSDTVDIGAARVRLIVDAADFQPIIDQGKSAIIGFGNVAQQAYDRTEKGTRRAADALLDYVNSLGRADTTMDKYIRNASRMGVEKPVLDAAITAWAKYSDQVEQAAQAQTESDDARKRAQAGLKELMSVQSAAEQQARSLANAQAAARIQNLQDAHASQSQIDVNRLVAPGLAVSGANSAEQQATYEALFAEQVAKANAELEQQLSLEQLITQARGQHRQDQAQQDFNRLLGIPEQQEALALAQRRRDAEAAFGVQLQREADLEDQAYGQNANIDSFIKQLNGLQQTAGKSYYELLQLKAAELGVSGAADPLIAKIKAQNQALGAGALSSKQYEFALRGLPAQFTDIVVSLQGGQKPLTVLLQQGGQIKDMFGGVGNAVKVVGKEIGKLVTNPWILLTGVVLALGAAAFDTQSHLTELSIATAKGNQVAGSATGLTRLADQLGKLDGVSIGNADAAVASLAAAGKLTGDNFDKAAQATAHWATITGQGVDEIAGKFNQLANDPMAAVLDGTLRVTAAQYEQLASFERTGDKIGEVALAVSLYQQQVNDNTESVNRNLSEGEKGWIALKDAITGAAHAVGEYVTKTAGASFNVFKQEGLSALLNPSRTGRQIVAGVVGPAENTGDAGVGALNAAQLAMRNAAMNAGVIESTKLTVDQTNANKENQKTLDEYGTKQQKFTVQLALMNAQLARSNTEFLAQRGIVKSVTGVLSGPGYEKAVNGLRLKVFGQDHNQGGDPTRPIKEWERTSLDAIKNVQQAQDYAYQAGAIGTETYYGVSKGLIKADEVIQLASIDKQIEALKGRQNSESQIAALEQQRYTVEETFASKKAKLDHDELLAVQAKINAYHDYVQTLADANIQLARQGEQAAGAVGTGSRQNSLAVAKQNAVFQEQLQERAIQDRVDALGPGDHADAQAQADKDKTAAAAALSTQLTILQGNYDSLATAEGSWINGSVKAWQDWQVQVSNQAQEAGKVFTMTMDGIANDIAEAAVSGKLSFKSLIDDLLRELVQFGIKQAELMAAKAAINSYNGGSSSSGDYGTNFSGWATTIGSLLFSAKGNTFGAGSGLASYRNSVVSQPTYFPFAKGGTPNVGLMGEKPGSPGEAIMPLTRTAGGELAVKTTGNGSNKTNNVYQTFVVPGAQTRQTQDQLAIKTYGAAQRAARRS